MMQPRSKTKKAASKKAVPKKAAPKKAAPKKATAKPPAMAAPASAATIAAAVIAETEEEPAQAPTVQVKWAALVSRSALAVGRAPGNIKRQLSEKCIDEQIAAVTEAGALEIITALELQSPSFHERTRVEALINTALCGPLNIPRGEIKVCHTLAKAALSAIVQNMLAA